MKSVYLLGTCRIQRPFGCEKNHQKPLKPYEYNLLNSWGSYGFLGPLHDIKEIHQFLTLLLDENCLLRNKLLNNETRSLYTKHILKNCNLQPDQFDKQLRFTQNQFFIADFIVIEVSTLRYFQTIIDGVDVILSAYNANLSDLNHYTNKKVTDSEFIVYLDLILEILKKYNKKVLFVTHFNTGNIAQREHISTILKQNLPENMVFDPSSLVISYLPHSIVDDYHYALDFEHIVMDEIHQYLCRLS